MNTEERINYITNWISDYVQGIDKKNVSLVIGVSGGIDSALTSTLCAKTSLNTIVVSMPIRQNENQHSLSLSHIKWLKDKKPNRYNGEEKGLGKKTLEYEKPLPGRCHSLPQCILWGKSD